MKRIFTSLMGLSLLTITTLSCSKDVQNETRQQAAVKPQVISANVPAGQTYVFDMGVGSSAGIVTQAQHYQLSQVTTGRDGGAVYKYIAGKGFAGGDEVTLQQTTTSTSQSSGCHNNHSNGSTTTTSVKTFVIKLNVAN